MIILTQFPHLQKFFTEVVFHVPYNSRGLKVDDDKLKKFTSVPVFPNLFYIVAHIEKKKCAAF